MGQAGFSVPGAGPGGDAPPQEGSAAALMLAAGMILGIGGTIFAVMSGVLFWEFATVSASYGLPSPGVETREPLAVTEPVEIWLEGRGQDLAAFELDCALVRGSQRIALVRADPGIVWKRYHKKGNPTPRLLLGTLVPPEPGNYELSIRFASGPPEGGPQVLLAPVSATLRKLLNLAYYACLAALTLGWPLFAVGLIKALMETSAPRGGAAA